MKLIRQIGIVLGICLVGEGIALLIPVPFPASVISMILLFILLMTRVLKPLHIHEKADFLKQNMAIFFIPSGVGIMQYFDVIQSNLIPLLAVCVLTTFITFGVTALTVRGVIRLQDWVRERKRNKV